MGLGSKYSIDLKFAIAILLRGGIVSKSVILWLFLYYHIGAMSQPPNCLIFLWLRHLLRKVRKSYYIIRDYVISILPKKGVVRCKNAAKNRGGMKILMKNISSSLLEILIVFLVL